jgi:hypothetical protein
MPWLDEAHDGHLLLLNAAGQLVVTESACLVVSLFLYWPTPYRIGANEKG